VPGAALEEVDPNPVYGTEEEKPLELVVPGVLVVAAAFTGLAAFAASLVGEATDPKVKDFGSVGVLKAAKPPTDAPNPLVATETLLPKEPNPPDDSPPLTPPPKADGLDTLAASLVTS